MATEFWRVQNAARAPEWGLLQRSCSWLRRRRRLNSCGGKKVPNLLISSLVGHSHLKEWLEVINDAVASMRGRDGTSKSLKMRAEGGPPRCQVKHVRYRKGRQRYCKDAGKGSKFYWSDMMRSSLRGAMVGAGYVITTFPILADIRYPDRLWRPRSCRRR
ncbi:hypothetical protein UVI_02051870 [Ustilaginoidea virens]|uniref:Uncharacterized protein n=1 Tax=Ustilaginoidea virens TaxID=1159556 RepID=A0A1B5L8Z2_USTVR|nr:hypothetical protein UVI_02051870 [Ustilaginoidea virens]